MTSIYGLWRKGRRMTLNDKYMNQDISGTTFKDVDLIEVIFLVLLSVSVVGCAYNTSLVEVGCSIDITSSVEEALISF